MDDRRFDHLTRSLATVGSRRTLIKGLLGLSGLTAAGSIMRQDQVRAATRPTPTPKPVQCPGSQTWNGAACVCATGTKCGPACCTGASQCCDNACCNGTCYGEERCCPTGQLVCNGTCLPLGGCCSDADCSGARCLNNVCVPYTPTSTPTNTPEPPTQTPTDTPTNTPVTPSQTPTDTPTNTTVPSTSTPTDTPTNTAVPPTRTPSDTPTNTLTPTCDPNEPGDCQSNTDCCSGICQSGRCVATTSGTCPAGVHFCERGQPATSCGGGLCRCYELADGGALCGSFDAECFQNSDGCPAGYLPNVGNPCCGGITLCYKPCPPH